MTDATLLVVGANPAWQKVLFFDEFRTNRINRAGRKLAFASGKGVNFCRAVRCCGRGTTRLLQFSGGETGARLDAALRAEGFSFHSVSLDGETRVCTTCLAAGGETTELIEPSAAASESAVAELLEAFRAALPSAALAALCGTLPSGTSPELYRRAAGLAAAAGVPLLVDFYQHVAPVLRETPENILLKINRDELSMLTGETDIPSGLRRLFAAHPLRLAAITAGTDDAWLSDGRRLFRYRIPPAEQLVNPIGCGDTASAVLAVELTGGAAPEDAFTMALGAAVANCATPRCGEFDPREAARCAAAVERTESILSNA